MLLLIAFLSIPSIAAASLTDKTKPSILFVNPSIKSDVFWQKTQQFAFEAAQQLQFDISVIYGDGTRFFQYEELKRYLENNKAPDYVVMINYPGNAKATMDLLRNYPSKIITIEQTISDQEKLAIGTPGDIYPNWLAEVIFSNNLAGSLLAKELISQAKQHKKPLVVAGISGHFGSESKLRNNGLLEVVTQEQAQLTQIVHANWSRVNAFEKTVKLLKRYPELSVIWCASDTMALGAIDAVKSLGMTPSKDVFVGGFDWINNALTSIEQGELTASVGGHYIMASIAVIAAHHDHQQIEHSAILSKRNNSFELDLLSQANIQDKLPLVQNLSYDKINFKQLAELFTTENKANHLPLLEKLALSIKPEH